MPHSKKRPYHMPAWLSLAWTHKRRRQESDRDVAAEMREFLLDCQVSLDHWGSATIDGQLCLVNEPYVASPELLLAGMQALATEVNGFAYVSAHSEHPGTIRAVVSQHPLTNLP